jgi:hypothetical protein
MTKNFLNGSNGRLNFGSETYVIQIEGMGIRKVYKYENEFKYFNFSNVQSTDPGAIQVLVKFFTDHLPQWIGFSSWGSLLLLGALHLREDRHQG